MANKSRTRDTWKGEWRYDPQSTFAVLKLSISWYNTMNNKVVIVSQDNIMQGSCFKRREELTGSSIARGTQCKTFYPIFETVTFVFMRTADDAKSLRETAKFRQLPKPSSITIERKIRQIYIAIAHIAHDCVCISFTDSSSQFINRYRNTICRIQNNLLNAAPLTFTF